MSVAELWDRSNEFQPEIQFMWPIAHSKQNMSRLCEKAVWGWEKIILKKVFAV